MSDTITLTPAELVLVLVKHADLHEGIWGLHVEFAFGAGNTTGPGGKDDVVPVAFVAATKIGLRKYDAESPISVDAAKVNPAKPLKGKSKGHSSTSP
jgi:hypothetical protein